MLQGASDETAPTALAASATASPAVFALGRTYPNPLRTTAAIPFDVPHAAHVTLAVYDVLGREVATVLEAPVEPGRHTARWEPHGLPSGLYLLRMSAEGFTATGTLTLVR